MTLRNPLVIGGVLLASAGLAACAGEDSPREDAPGARVTRVIDGDTVEMERLGKVRLIGVNTPEKNRCYDDAATRFTRDRLEGQVVQYEMGEEPKDRYDRALAYLSREGEMHNLALLTEGYAKVLTIPPNDKYEERFEQAEREAKKADSGLWDKCDRDAIRARRAAAKRRKEKAEAKRLAAAERRTARRARRAARALDELTQPRGEPCGITGRCEDELTQPREELEPLLRDLLRRRYGDGQRVDP